MGVWGHVPRKEKEKTLTCQPVSLLPVRPASPPKHRAPPSRSTCTCEIPLSLEMILQLHMKITDVNIHNELWMKHTLS